MAAQCEKRYITADDIKDMNARFQGYKGISESEYDNFIKKINACIRKDKWSVDDLRYLKAVVEGVSARPHLEYIFLVLNNHPQWPKYFKNTVHILPTESITKLRKDLPVKKN